MNNALVEKCSLAFKDPIKDFMLSNSDNISHTYCNHLVPPSKMVVRYFYNFFPVVLQMMVDTLSQFLDSHRPEWNLLISHFDDAYINFSLISRQYFIGFFMQLWICYADSIICGQYNTSFLADRSRIRNAHLKTESVEADQSFFYSKYTLSASVFRICCFYKENPLLNVPIDLIVVIILMVAFLASSKQLLPLLNLKEEVAGGSLNYKVGFLCILFF